jgi:hypothetical protein
MGVVHHSHTGIEQQQQQPFLGLGTEVGLGCGRRFGWRTERTNPSVVGGSGEGEEEGEARQAGPRH